MKRSTFSAVAAAALLGWGAAGCGKRSGISSGGFSPPDRTGAVAYLHGRALSSPGVPAPGVDVFLVTAGVATHVARTDDKGELSLDHGPVGATTLVLNDGHGQGVVREMVLYADGKNEAGDLMLESLGHFPTLVTVHGIGYEERMTAADNDYLFPVWSSRGDKAYAVRRDATVPTYRIYEIDTGTGAERLLIEEPLLDTSAGPPATLRLVGDRILMYRKTGLDYSDVRMQIPLDVTRGVPLLGDNLTNHGDLLDFTWIEGNAIYQMTGWYDPRALSQTNQLHHRVARIPLVEVAPSSSIALELNKGAEFHKFWLFAQGGGLVAYIPQYCIAPNAAGCRGVDESSDPRHLSIQRLGAADSHDATTIAVDQLVPIPFDARTAGVVAGSLPALYLLRRDGDPGCPSVGAKISRVDVATGAVTDIVNGSAGRYFAELWAFPTPRDELIVNGGLVVKDRVVSELARLDLTTHTLTPLQTAFSVAGVDYMLCDLSCDSIRCKIEPHADGSLRVTEVLTRGHGPDSLEGPHPAAVVDFDAGNNLVRAFFLTVPSDGQVPSLVRSPDGLLDAFSWSQTIGGFSQAWTMGRAEETPAQRTSLSADHSPPVFSPDGAWLYYFMRDPLSGFVQLFRVAAG